MEINFESKYGVYLKEILDMYIPILQKLYLLRVDPNFTQVEQVKAMGDSGVEDVVTKADIWVQEEIKKLVAEKHPEWQFWAEEGGESELGSSASFDYLFIVDPIEGTNNFRAHKDEYWGSVVSLVDNNTNEPVLGVVAQPKKKRIFVGVKGEGAFSIKYNEQGAVEFIARMDNKPERNSYTYNNSPHFNKHLQNQVTAFKKLGVAEDMLENATDLERSRETLIIEDKRFEDVEAGALEPLLHRGVIMFKTSIEMAALFPIAEGLGAKVANAQGDGWSPDMNTLIFARSEDEWEDLKNLYDRARSGAAG